MILSASLHRLGKFAPQPPQRSSSCRPQANGAVACRLPKSQLASTADLKPRIQGHMLRRFHQSIKAVLTKGTRGNRVDISACSNTKYSHIQRHQGGRQSTSKVSAMNQIDRAAIRRRGRHHSGVFPSVFICFGDPRASTLEFGSKLAAHMVPRLDHEAVDRAHRHT